MLNRFLGIDNCIKCSKLLKLPDEVKCLNFKKKIELACFGVPLKLSCCIEPFKYDSNDENNSDEEMCV